MVIDIGGGTTDVAVISLGGIVVSQSIRVAGNKMDEAIVRHIRRVYNFDDRQRAHGRRDQNQNRLVAYRLEFELVMEIRGRDLINGLPKTVKITSEEVREALSEPIQSIVEAVKVVLEKTPPELSADIIDRGMVLTGGGALLREARHVARRSYRHSGDYRRRSVVVRGDRHRLARSRTPLIRIDATRESVERVAEEVAAVVFGGGTVIFPTDTVYGIGCDPMRTQSVERIFALREQIA